MFIAELFTIAKLWKQPRCPTTDEWYLYTTWYLYTMEFYSVMNKYYMTTYYVTDNMYDIYNSMEI
jgi:hypothetical protein